MTRFIPKFIHRQYENQQTNGRFFGTAIYAEVNGLTELIDQFLEKEDHDAKTLTDLMRDLFDPLIELVQAHDGFVAQFTSNGFIALFPDPASRSEKESMWRGLATAIHLQGKLGQAVQPLDAYGIATNMTIGVAHGLVEWGILTHNLGSPSRVYYYFGGTAVRDCQRSTQDAEPGTIAISSYVYLQLNAFVETRPLGNESWAITLYPSVPPAPSTSSQMLEEPAPLASPFTSKLIRHQPRDGQFRTIIALQLNFQNSYTYTQLKNNLNIVFQLQERYRGHITEISFNDQGAICTICWGVIETFDNDLKRASSFLADYSKIATKPFCAGMAYGTAYMGFIGSKNRQSFLGCGSILNLANQLMIYAPWGAMWINEAIQQRIADRFEIEQIDTTYATKLLGQPIYSLKGLQETASNKGNFHLIGRSKELTQLLEFTAPIFQDQFAGSIAIYGASGIGKSYIVSALYDHLQYHPLANKTGSAPPVLLRFQGDEFTPQALTAIRQMLRRYFNVSKSYSPGINQRHFDSVWQFMLEVVPDTLKKELQRTHDFTAALVNLPVYKDILTSMPPELRRQNITAALINIIKTRGCLQPVIIHIEDGQWLDEESRQILSEIATHFQLQPNGAPVAIISTSQSSTKQTSMLPAVLAPQSQQTKLKLRELNREHVHQMAEYVLDDTVATNLIELLLERTGGNPLFIEQMLLYLKENDYLSNSANGITIAHHFDQSTPIPATVQAILIERVEKLPDQVRHLVQIAAVIGREFPLVLLQDILGLDEYDLILRLQMAMQQGICAPVGEDEDAYEFEHNMLHTAAYNMLFLRQQQQLHQLVAKSIEKIYADSLTDHYGELAYHYQLASNFERERFFNLLAGDSAVSEFANQTALHFYSRALDLTSDKDLEKRYIILEKREAVYSAQKQRSRQAKDLNKIEKLVKQLDDGSQHAQIRYAEIALRRAKLALAIHDYAEAMQHATKVIEIAQEQSIKSLQADGHFLHGNALMYLTRFDECRKTLHAGLALVKQPNQLSKFLALLGDVATAEYNYEQAESFYHQAQSLYKDSDNNPTYAALLAKYARYKQRIGDYAAALEIQNKTITLFQSVGDRVGEADIYRQRGRSYYYIGNYTRAREEYIEAFRLSGEQQDQEGIGFILAYQAVLSHMMGNYMVADIQASQAEIIADESENRELHGLSQLILGRIALAQNETAVAKKWFTNALQTYYKLNDIIYAIQAVAGLARTSFHTGQQDNAIKHIERVMQRLHDDGILNEHRTAPNLYLVCYRILNAYGDKRRKPVLQKGHDVLHKQAQRISSPEIRQTFLQNIPAHREIRAAYSTVFEE